MQTIRVFQQGNRYCGDNSSFCLSWNYSIQ